MAGSASVAIIISRDEPMPPKLVPTSMPASASSARAAPSSATSATDVGRPVEHQARSEALRTRAAATQVKGEDQVGRIERKATGALGDHRVFAQQLSQVEIALQQRRALAAHQPRLDPAYDADGERRDQQHEGHLGALRQELHDEVAGHVVTAAMAEQDDEGSEHQHEVAPDGEELQRIQALGRGRGRPGRAPRRAHARHGRPAPLKTAPAGCRREAASRRFPRCKGRSAVHAAQRLGEARGGVLRGR